MEEQIIKEIEIIKERNKKVELDKKWETSIFRRVIIGILTYIIVLIFSSFINNKGNIFLGSFIPVIGFTLSTLSMDIVKKYWIKKQK